MILIYANGTKSNQPLTDKPIEAVNHPQRSVRIVQWHDVEICYSRINQIVGECNLPTHPGCFCIITAKAVICSNMMKSIIDV